MHMEIKPSNHIGHSQLTPECFDPNSNKYAILEPILCSVLYEVMSLYRWKPAVYLTLKSWHHFVIKMESSSSTCNFVVLLFFLTITCVIKLESTITVAIWHLKQNLGRLGAIFVVYLYFTSRVQQIWQWFMLFPDRGKHLKIKYFQVYSTALNLVAPCGLVKSAESNWPRVLQ